MKKIAFALALASVPALASDAPPTVTLTQAELGALVTAEIARRDAAPVMQKLEKAFAPPAPAKDINGDIPLNKATGK